jgi:hypothetical protein
MRNANTCCFFFKLSQVRLDFSENVVDRMWHMSTGLVSSPVWDSEGCGCRLYAVAVGLHWKKDGHNKPFASALFPQCFIIHPPFPNFIYVHTYVYVCIWGWMAGVDSALLFRHHAETLVPSSCPCPCLGFRVPYINFTRGMFLRPAGVGKWKCMTDGLPFGRSYYMRRR